MSTLFDDVQSHAQEPLRKITAFGDLLRKDIGIDLPERAESDLSYMLDGARRMQELIGHLLLLSRTGSAAMRREKVSLGKCAQKALDTLRLRMEERHALVEVDNLPEMAVDQTMIVQLYQNLIGNALKYSSGRRPEIRLTVRNVDDQYVFGVRDNGIGVAPEYAEQIFAPFKRLHSRSEYEGTGIGLSICRRIVERHGGTIWVESQPGEGSYFKFTLAKKANREVEEIRTYAVQ